MIFKKKVIKLNYFQQKEFKEDFNYFKWKPNI